MRKTEQELWNLLDEVSKYIGEHPVEYVGYGRTKPYAKFLYEYFKENYTEKPPLNIDLLLSEISNIWAYFDVHMAFEEYYEDICDKWDGSDNFEFELMAKFLVSDYCDDDTYKDFIECMEEYLSDEEDDEEDE